MYKVVGIDGNAYGPVPADLIRKWIAERRVNAQTPIQAEGSSEWKPLRSYAEFAAEFAASPGNPPPAGEPLPPGAPPSFGTYAAGAPDPRASNKVASGVCGILLGSLGVHKFILGYTGAGLVMLLVTILTCGVAWPLTHLIGLIEGILYLTKSDQEFVRLYVDAKRPWF